MKKKYRDHLPVATRRDFLRNSAASAGLVSLGSLAPQFLVDTAEAAGSAALDRDGRILVLVKLGGGNDCLNTLVPVTDDTY